MPRRRGKKGNNKSEAPVKETKKQGMGSDIKPTRCSMCRFALDPQTNSPCYQKAKLLPNLEYVDCIPAIIHYSDKKLSALHLI